MNDFRFQISNLRFPRANRRLIVRVLITGLVLLGVAFLATEAFARVGGGGSYGGGGSHGGGGGGAGAIVYLLVRFLLWLTIEHPVIGIPVDIIVIAAVIYWFAKPSQRKVDLSSTSIIAPDAPTTVQQQNFQRAFNQLRRFDPNFSEIIF